MSGYKKIAGVDVLVKVKKDTTMIPVGGQTGASLSRSAEAIDVTDKTSGGWMSSIAGMKSWGIDSEGFVCLGDEAFELLEKAFEERQPVEIDIRIGADDDVTGVTYVGNAYITDFPLEAPQDSAVTYSLSFSGAGELTRTKGAVSPVALATKATAKK